MFFDSLNNQNKKAAKPDITIKISSKWLELRPGKEETLELVKKE